MGIDAIARLHGEIPAISAMRGVLLVLVACGSESKPPPKQEPVPSPVVVADAAAPDAAPAPAPRYALGASVKLPDIDGVHALVVQPDGKVLVVGDAGIARVGVDFAIDTTFGKAGVVRLVGKGTHSHRAIVDAKGRIVVAGNTWDEKREENLLLARFLLDGKLDASFGTGGRVELDIDGTDDRPSGVFANGDELVVIGNHELGKDGPHYNQYLARFDGRGDKTLVVFFDCMPDSREFVTRARVDGDGYVMTGYATGESDGIFVARLRGDGTLDPAYGEQGVTWVRSKELAKPVSWMLVQLANGDILVGGQGGAQDTTSVLHTGYVARFDKQGKLITSWGKNGIAWAQDGSNWISFVAPDGDGFIAVERYKPGLLSISATGQAGATTSPEEDGRYDEGVLLESGDLIVAGDKLLRFAKK